MGCGADLLERLSEQTFTAALRGGPSVDHGATSIAPVSLRQDFLVVDITLGTHLRRKCSRRSLRDRPVVARLLVNHDQQSIAAAEHD